jgi:hypothetical protein
LASVSRTPSTRQQQGSRIAVGQQLASFGKYDWHSHTTTLVLALRKGCHYCEDSAPFYRKLTDLENSGEIKNAHLLAIFPDSLDDVRNTLQSESLVLESIPSFDFGVLGIEGTPTAILVDNAGKILDVWVGELSLSQQRTLLDALQFKSKS